MQKQRSIALGTILFGLITVMFITACKPDGTPEMAMVGNAVGSTHEVANQVVANSTSVPVISRTKDPVDTFPDGQWDVGVHILPGVYSLLEEAENCYWERLSNWSGCSSDVIEKGFITGDTGKVTITNADMGFSSEGCGTWVRIGDVE